MSIIRSNIARQLLAEGGAPRSPGNTTLQRVLPRMDGIRPGFYGPDMGEGGKESDFGAGTYDDVDVGGVDFGGESGGTRQEFRDTAEAIGTPKTPSMADNFRANELRKRTDRIFGDSGLSLSFVANLLKGPQREVYNKDMIAPDLDQYGISGKDLTTVRDIQDTLDKFQETGRLSQSDFEDVYFGPGGKPPKGEGGDNEPIIKKLKSPITEKIEEPKGEFDDILKFYGAKFEDGGEVRQNYGLGSIVKKVTGAVKKVAKSPLGKAAILAFGAKFAKPDLFTSAFAPDSFIMKNKALSGILAASLASGLYAKKEEEDETLPTVSNTDPEFQKYLAFYGGPRRFAEGGGDINEAPIKMASHEGNTQLLEQLYEDFLDLGFSPEDAARKAKEEFDNMSKKQDMPKQQMASYGYDDAMAETYDTFLEMKEKQLIPPGMDFREFLQEVVPEMSKKQGIERATAAGGGMMNPNDEMLNLSGNEMDLRGGGFVPLGEYEKKDDVPARLSKNEFVFTADAVKAAGGGSVDRGADIMYKTMKNLENKIA